MESYILAYIDVHGRGHARPVLSDLLNVTARSTCHHLHRLLEAEICPSTFLSGSVRFSIASTSPCNGLKIKIDANLLRFATSLRVALR